MDDDIEEDLYVNLGEVAACWETLVRVIIRVQKFCFHLFISVQNSDINNR